MTNRVRFSTFALLLVVGATAFRNGKPANTAGFTFPYAAAGLSEKEAAAHLLSRFTFGTKPGQVDEVVAMGLENWFALQLKAELPEDDLTKRLAGFSALTMSTQQIVEHFPDPGQLLIMGIADGTLSREDVAKMKGDDKQAYRRQVKTYLDKKGLEPKSELNRQLINQKILRAAYANNQLQEVMTAFWFNHFNISLTKNQSSKYVLPYERDVIRPNALGNFETLLVATAKSPAMLTYLDNARSMVDADHQTGKQQQRWQYAATVMDRMEASADTSSQEKEMMQKVLANRKNQGLNENYAREVMELHTLGVDGGYTQTDVTEAARILTGWTLMPADGAGKQLYERLSARFTPEQLAKQGFVQEGDFLFAANRHDFAAKHFLNQDFPAGGGYQEGLTLLHELATSTATANFICTKIATRFVSDEPSPVLVKKMAATFQQNKGDIKAVLITLVTAPEFWKKEATREKTKSPFELAISAVRGVDADITMPYQLFRWTTKMGEEVYHYQAPTGFPDRARYWINSGALLYRMNFGLAFANNQIPGITYDLGRLTNYHEPESPTAALEQYGAILLPERNLEETFKRLLPLINDPSIESKIANAAEKTPVNHTADMEESLEDEKTLPANSDKVAKTNTGTGMNQKALAQVLGILIGSPEFQRR